jgi:hypothetical protein
MDNTATTDRRPACNKGLAKVAIQCSAVHQLAEVKESLYSARKFYIKIATFKPETVTSNTKKR